jgi:hypothetical protein
MGTALSLGLPDSAALVLHIAFPQYVNLEPLNATSAPAPQKLGQGTRACIVHFRFNLQEIALRGVRLAHLL